MIYKDFINISLEIINTDKIGKSMQVNRQFFGNSDEEIDIMPIVPLTEDEMSDEDKKLLPEDLVILPLRNMVLFPNVGIPITVSREKSIKA